MLKKDFPTQPIFSFRLLSGILFCSVLALLALMLNNFSKLGIVSPLLLSVIIGISYRNLIGITPNFFPGIRFCHKRLLKFAIVLLGLKLSLSEIQTVGFNGFIVVLVSIVSTFGFTIWLGKRLGVEQKLVYLLAAGTSICGASAIVATNSAIESSDEDVVYAISLVTIMGTVATFIYPVLQMTIHLSPEAFGIWCGASIQDVAQVIAASFQNGDTSGMLATISKLSRVLFLIPMILILSYASIETGVKRNSKSINKLPIPWFIVLFLLAVIVNSFNLVPQDVKSFILQVNPILLSISLVALGLQTNLSKIGKIGLKPIYLAGSSWLFLAFTSLGLITAFKF